jgi:RNA polymerase sigma-70 factor (ECF subfamily)
VIDVEPSDAELVGLVAEPGEDRQRAERLLCARFLPRVRRYAEHHLGDARAAADLTQDVMVAVIEALRARRIEDPERLGAFVLSTCRYLTWDENRDTKRRRRLSELIGAEAGIAGETALTSMDLRKLEDCVRRLPQREQRVVNLTYAEEWPADRIAKEIETTPGNVRVLRHRALAWLSECIEKHAKEKSEP